ncbi:MAG: ATP-binding protein [Lachnospiraceae bacterium]|nr:ATP-binding protein [Lachnospiraceae bacterium]
MNSEIAKQRLSEVVRIDTITSSYGDFMATHVPFKQIQLQKEYDVSSASKTYTEEQIYKKVVLNPKDQHQFVLVIGSSGAGKSHLIRWFDAKIEKQKPDSEVVLFVRRSDNTLKGTIKQLLEKPEVASIQNKDLYERLVNATSTISESKLMNAIYHQFIVEIEDDNGEDIDYINNVDRKRIVPLLNNELFKARMIADDGPIARIYSKVAESNVSDNRDVVPEFLPEDFQVDIAFCDKVQYDGGDKKAVRLLEKLYMEPEGADAVAKYLNSKVDTVIQSCAGLEPGDFEQVFKEIRKELKKQGKSLTLLIEDITAFTGVNEALLNVLTTWHTGDYEQEGMCRISSIIGTTSEYYKSNFRDNYKDRVTQFIVIPDDVFGSSEDDLCEFVGRYLNAMSLPKDEVDTWANSDGSGDSLPVHEVKQGNGWDVAVTEEGKSLNLFPFSRRSIVYLYYNFLQENYRTPRYLLRDIVEKTVRDALWNFNNFPGFKIVNTNINSNLRDAIQKTGVSNEQFERMYLFMCIWGDATTDTYQEGEYTYISGLSTQVYEDMRFPLINGKKVSGKPIQTKPVSQADGQASISTTVVKTPAQIAAEQKLQVERAQLNESLQVIENWIAGGTINVGATTGNVVLISKAREDMCSYLYSAIDWQAEGVSMDNIDKIKKVKERLVGFERQKRGVDQMFYKLPADRETQAVIEAFLEWNVLGKRSWNFDGADSRVYRVQLWTEKIKKPLIEAITSFENREIDYFKCAMMAEFYRIILLGSSKATTVEGLKAEHILDNGIRGLGVNSHSDAWNSLLSIITRSENDKINRETVIQYCNVIQGESHAQVFLDREKFDAMVRTVKNEKLTIESSILDLMDPVKPRRDARDYLRMILERLDKVQEDELAKAAEIMATIKENFGTTDVDDEDIEDMVEKIVEFYRTAEDGKLPGKYDQELFNEVKKYSTSTSKAIKEIVAAQKKTNALDCILAFSQDPIRKVEKLDQLLKKVVVDMAKIQAELTIRKEKLGGGSNPSGSQNIFDNEKVIISECNKVLARLEGTEC